MTASLVVSPAAKALMPGSSSRTYTAGTGRPDAIAISSTTLSSRRSLRSTVCESTRRPPTLCATAAPPSEYWLHLYSDAAPTTRRVPPVTTASTCGCHSDELDVGAKLEKRERPE